MHKLLLILFTTLLILPSCNKDEALVSQDDNLKSKLIKSSISYESKVNGDAVNVECLDGALNLSGGRFPVDSMMLDGSKAHVNDLTFSESFWITYFSQGTETVYYDFSYNEGDDPCAINSLGILEFNSIVAIHPEFGLIQFDSSTLFLADGVIVDAKNLEIVIDK